MTKQRRRLVSQNPFSLYRDMFNAGIQMTQLFTSSAQVIAHRSDMISRAMKGEIPLHHKEFTEMWLEKFLAGGASMMTAFKYMGNMQSGTTGSMSNMMHILAPFRKKAMSNARRLSKNQKSKYV